MAKIARSTSFPVVSLGDERWTQTTKHVEMVTNTMALWQIATRLWHNFPSSYFVRLCSDRAGNGASYDCILLFQPWVRHLFFSSQDQARNWCIFSPCGELTAEKVKYVTCNLRSSTLITIVFFLCIRLGSLQDKVESPIFRRLGHLTALSLAFWIRYKRRSSHVPCGHHQQHSCCFNFPIPRNSWSLVRNVCFMTTGFSAFAFVTNFHLFRTACLCSGLWLFRALRPSQCRAAEAYIE
jgi:hypothetical protein